MSIWICIDDSDNIDSVGTGEVADRIKAAIKADLGYESSLTTRHQLLIHEDIPYTSHNSSMCFQVTTDSDIGLEPIIGLCRRVIESNMADGSDPGLCIVQNPSTATAGQLINFGQSAKNVVLTKVQAYSLAADLEIHLSELGGTGDGVIGAMAGIGLRLSGNDGEVKGGLKDIDEGVFTAAQLLERRDVSRIMELPSGAGIQEGEIIFKKRSKSILRDGKYTLLVLREGNRYIALGKRMIRQMETEASSDPMDEEGLQACHKFDADVVEEQLDNEKTCHNCRHRRWQAKGYKCMLGL